MNQPSKGSTGVRASDVGAESQRELESAASDGAGGVRALERGLRLIRCFDVDHPSWRIAQLSRAVGLHKATARRLVKTLEAEGFLIFNPESGEYALGSALMPVAYLVRSHDQLRQVAHPYMEELAALTEETVGLSVWTDGGIVSIEHIPTIHFFKPTMLLGNVSSTYGTSHSKIFLAFGPEQRLEKLSFGDRGRNLTLAEASRVQDELQKVRESGVAYDIEERAKGVCAVGVPLRDSTGQVVAAIAVVTPTDRFGPVERESITERIRQTGAAISRELGFKG